MAHKTRGRQRPPTPVFAALLLAVICLFSHEKAAPLPDLPAADEPAGFPLPVVEQSFSESSALPHDPVDAVPAQPVFQPDPGEFQRTGVVYYKNQTDYAIDMPSLLTRNTPVTLGTEGVQVLIMHTHGTEAYTPSPAHPYTASGEYRTTDSRANMLRVGQAICDILNARGISTVHSTVLNDYPAYNGSYNRALKEIQAQIARYPSAQLVIDVHRDAIASGDTYYKTSAQVNGMETAQLMFVTGTDGGGLSHPNWRENLAFQAQLHDELNSRYPGLMRPMSIRESRYNQHIRVGSMLLEVGSCGNTLEEALAAAELFAQTLADVLLQP